MNKISVNILDYIKTYIKTTTINNDKCNVK